MMDYRMEEIYGLVDEALKAGPRQSPAAGFTFSNDGRKINAPRGCCNSDTS
jgi:hypothetical protein